MQFKVKKFNELTVSELYEILKARAEIFIVEQDINYQDMDDIDYQSIHFFIEQDGKVEAYLRAFYTDDTKTVLKIGRVLTMSHGNGLGRDLMEKSTDAIKKNFNCEKLFIHAQTHAVGFYEKFGFKAVSDEFMEEGIMHIKMELKI